MHIRAIRIRPLIPPKDGLLSTILESSLTLKDGDVVAIASKVVSIGEGRCVPTDEVSKESLARQEAQLYADEKPRFGSRFTITKGVLIRAAGIDESNGDGHYILWPKDPRRSAAALRRKLMAHYRLKKLGVLITDSMSTPLRRGAIGFALAWSGFEPLYDYRGSKDIFGRVIGYEQANLADALAGAAVAVMGEGSERTPVARIRGAPERIWHKRRTRDSLIVPPKDDLFAQFLNKAKWKKGKADS